MPYFHHMTNMQVLRAFGRQSKEKKCDGDVDREQEPAPTTGRTESGWLNALFGGHPTKK